MAGSKTGEFIELVSPFLRRKMAELEARQGPDSAALRSTSVRSLSSARYTAGRCAIISDKV